MFEKLSMEWPCLLFLTFFRFLEISSIDKSNFCFQARSLVYILSGFYWLPFCNENFLLRSSFFLTI